MAGTFYYDGGYSDRAAPDNLDLSSLSDFVDGAGGFGVSDEWSPYHRSKPEPIPTIPKPEPDGFGGLDLETVPLPQQQYWFNGSFGPQMAGSFSTANPQMLQLSQPPTPGVECQVTSSTMSPVSPFSPNSDVSFDDRQDGSPGPFSSGADGYDLDVGDTLGELKLTGLTEEQLVSLSARDLNRLCREMPEDVIKQLKKRRRTLKNRGYAYNSRVRRVSQKNVLEKERDDLKQQIHQLTERYRLLERERDSWKRRAQAIEKAEV